VKNVDISSLITFMLSPMFKGFLIYSKKVRVIRPLIQEAIATVNEFYFLYSLNVY
jgi:hypothetical protein